MEARNVLVLRYLPAMRRYIAALLRGGPDADDVTHDVVVRLLSGDFAGADPARGRFRDLLKTAIRNMVRNRWAQQKRRRTVDQDPAEVADGHDAGDDTDWAAQWRQSVLDLAWKDLEQQERTRPTSACHTLLRLRTDYPDDTSEQLAERFSRAAGQTVRADAVRQKLRRARLQFADLLIAEIAKGLHDPTPEKIEDELIALGLMDLVRDLLPPDWKPRAG
jgi:RNA polymerase sigma-70 factor (ECF subfamily)